MKRYILFIVCAAIFVQAKSVVIEVEGMTCPLCTSAVKHSLKKVPGVTRAKVRLNTKKATVTFDGNVSNAALLEAVKKAGYKGKLVEQNSTGSDK
jgi:mercuric ion binding protein